MRDYQGDMDYFQNQLTKHGISKDDVNMDDYVGLTAKELQSIVNYAIKKKKEEENAKTL